MKTVCLGFVLWAGVAFATEVRLERAGLDVTLRDTQDQTVRLSQFRGKPAVLIYEDRGSTEVNRPFKNALRQQSVRAQAIHVVAVANVSRYNFFPIRGLALRGVRDAERRAQFPILVDWEGALVREPWNLPANTSTVMVLNREGNVVFSRSGPLSLSEQGEVFALLEDLLQPSLAGER